MDTLSSQRLPLQSIQTTNTQHSNQIQCGTNGRFPIIGHVVRVRPNIFNFVCGFCRTEHKTIDNFLRHSESHFQCDSSTAPRTMTQIHSNQNPTETIQSSTTSTSNAPYPVQLSKMPRVDITSSPPRSSEDLIEEIYEITDLGYDHDGKYPDAINVTAVSLEKPAKQKPPKSRRKIKKSTNGCWFCHQNFSRLSLLKQHESSAHANIFKKILTLKKNYKCQICRKKFSKKSHTQRQALEHLKIHTK